MSNLTIITPAAPYHLPMLRRCIDSVRAQTVTVEHLVEVDEERLGPGFVRNRLLKQVTTPFVSFLDADDMLEPDFAEKTLAVVGQKYIYTDWLQDGDIVKAPDCAWINKTFHLVTAVVPTAWALAVDGFDEKLTGMEDADFYLRLIARGYCGKRLNVPLVHYSANGGRAKTIHETGTVRELAAEMQRRYGGMKVGCCGHNEVLTAKPSGERLTGDVLAQALWHGNRAERGLVSGRHYPRTSYPKTCYVDPRDVDYAPRLWRRLEETPETEETDKVVSVPKPQARGLDALAQSFIPKPIKEAPVLVTETAKKVIREQWTPDFDKVRKLAGKKTSSAVWFVMPDKDWPSYGDFWKLVGLSGYQVASTTYAVQNLNNRDYTFIFVTPEGIPDCSKAQARCIFWQFEYAGDYTQQKNRETCTEQWSSDPYNAQQTGARYVLLGSHDGLREGTRNATDPLYDIVTLSYLTPRRRAVYTTINHTFAPDYPGHSGKTRTDQLNQSRLMLHVNQHDEPALAPIKLSLAAAYRLPVVAEAVIDPGPYAEHVLFSSYDNIPNTVEAFLSGDVFDNEWLYSALNQLLCVEYPFRRCVEEALVQQEVRVLA